MEWEELAEEQNLADQDVEFQDVALQVQKVLSMLGGGIART